MMKQYMCLFIFITYFCFISLYPQENNKTWSNTIQNFLTKDTEKLGIAILAACVVTKGHAVLAQRLVSKLTARFSKISPSYNTYFKRRQYPMMAMSGIGVPLLFLLQESHSYDNLFHAQYTTSHAALAGTTLGLLCHPELAVLYGIHSLIP